MLSSDDKFSLTHQRLNESTNAIRGIESAILSLKGNYIRALDAAVDGRGSWSEVATARGKLEEALLGQVELQRMRPD